MAISGIRLQNYRSYTDSTFEFNDGVNVIVGPNACGKTNLLEAILVLATGQSYRVGDEDLVQYDKPWARLDGYFGKEKRTVKLEQKGDKIAKSYIIDDKPRLRLNFETVKPIVLFEPNDLQLIFRGPDKRRGYIDDVLERTDKQYRTIIRDYRRVLAQRNRLLKNYNSNLADQLFPWNIRLSDLGGMIFSKRNEYLDKLNQILSDNYSQIAGIKAEVLASYVSRIDGANYSSSMLRKLEADIDLDRLRGFTSAGPHRDDIRFSINSQPAENTASRGEMRSLILSIKMFELSRVTEFSDQSPILLLDDVFSELDTSRRRSLINRVSNIQTIITTTDADSVIEHLDQTKYQLIAI